MKLTSALVLNISAVLRRAILSGCSETDVEYSIDFGREVLRTKTTNECSLLILVQNLYTKLMFEGLIKGFYKTLRLKYIS